MATYTTNINLKKPAQSDKIRIADFNGNADNIDAAVGAGFGQGTNPSINQSINNLADGLAILATGNVHAAISAGQFVYVRGHGTLTEGLYVANQAISANGTLSNSNLDADGSGGLNALNSNIATQSATVAKANANYTYGDVTFEKTANYVRVMIAGFVSLPAQGFTDICAIPAGFAPSGTKYFDVFVGTNESGANLRTIRFRINGTTLSVYNYSTELSNLNAQTTVMYIC